MKMSRILCFGVCIVYLSSSHAYAGIFGVENVDTFVKKCVSPMEEIRKPALEKLVGDVIYGATKTEVLQKITYKVFNIIPELNVMLETINDRKERIRRHSALILVEDAILQTYSSIDHPTAKDFVLANLDYNPGFLVGSETVVLFGVKVSNYQVPRYVITFDAIQLNDMVDFLTDQTTHFQYPENYEAFIMHCMIQLLRKKGFSWEESKGIIRDEILKQWDVDHPSKNKSQVLVIDVIL